MSGDRGAEAFDRLYTEHAAGLLAFLTYQTGDRALAEDIVADSFERVLTARSGWRGHSGEKTWLYATSHAGGAPSRAQSSAWRSTRGLHTTRSAR
jgi:DNA-directed RNA polymerase specialized sigma24 family protein